MNRTKNASRNIIWGILSKVVTLGMPFFTRTVMIYTMGMTYVGLGSLFSSVLQVLSFAELGIGSALVFSLYKPIAENDNIKVCALLNFYRKTYRIIGTVILCLGLLMMPFLKVLIAGDTPENVNIYILFAVYLLNNILGYYLFAYKQVLFTASQRMDMISKIGMVLQCVSSILQIAVLFLFQNYYLYVCIIPIITVLNNVCLAILTDRYYPQYKCKGKIDNAELKSIEKKVGGMVFQKIGTIVLSSVDTIVISAFLGLTSLALYQNYYYIITSLLGVLSVIMQSIIAGVGNSVASETNEKNYKDFNKFNFIYIWIVTWCSVCLLCLYQPFMKIWVGTKNMLGTDMVILFSIYFFVHKWCDMLYVYQEACGIWWETKFVPLIAAIVNLVINIILVQIMGLPGILISTIIAVILVYDTGYAKVLFGTYFKPIEKGLFKYWIRQGLYFLSAVLIAAITVFACRGITFKSTICQLIYNGLICVIIPNVIYIIFWNKTPEFGYAKDIINKIIFRLVKK